MSILHLLKTRLIYVFVQFLSRSLPRPYFPYWRQVQCITCALLALNPFALAQPSISHFEAGRLEEKSSANGLLKLSEIRLAKIFGDGCVLQRDLKVPVWGTAPPASVIEVEINGQSKQTSACSDGNWRIELDAEPAGGPYSLTISGKNLSPIRLSDVYFGDVWLLSGQSNMFWTLAEALRDTPEYYPEMPAVTDDFEDVRFTIIGLAKSETALKDPPLEQVWTRWQGNQLRGMSTIGYFFTRNLNRALDTNGYENVPLGIIKTAYPGTMIEEWISSDKLQEVVAIKPNLEIRSGSSGCYNAMISPLQDYPIKGILWYQGEGNAGSITRIEQYPLLKQVLVDSWREQWKNGDFPFYFVQLAPYFSHTMLPGDELWAWMRESQASCLSISKTAMACIIDSGLQGNIHPPFKERAGERLARIALNRTYNISKVDRGPVVKDIEINGSEIIITFNEVAEGLEMRAVNSQPDAMEIAADYPSVSVTANELAGFYLCGVDKKFYPASEAEIVSHNRVRLANTVSVPVPVAVRYAFQNYPRCNLFNSEGLPAEPFRTDNFIFGETDSLKEAYP